MTIFSIYYQFSLYMLAYLALAFITSTRTVSVLVGVCILYKYLLEGIIAITHQLNCGLYGYSVTPLD